MQTILIIGGGFAGLDAALSAARRRELEGRGADDLRIVMVAPEPKLVIRPRLYEPNPETMAAPFDAVLDTVGVEFVAGKATAIDAIGRKVTVETPGGERSMSYDRLVVATGSQLFRPPVPGLTEFGFSVDQIDDAVALDRHIHALADRPDTPARATVVVAGGGFTGIEAATEMPPRLRKILGDNAAVRVVIVERADTIAPDMGANAQPYICAALADVGVETRAGVGVAEIDAGGVTLSDGQRIEAQTVIWSAGMRAAPFAGQVPGEFDNSGRAIVDEFLRAPSAPGIFVTGDAAKAASDTLGNYSLMSCQHAKRLGAFAGNNAAAELLGASLEPYHQRAYVTCLDLGPAGALLTQGWDREVQMTGPEAKAMKQEINTVWIYPPQPDRDAIFAYAEPAKVVDLEQPPAS